MARILLFLYAVACCGQQLVFTPFHTSGIYDIGEKVGWTITADGTPGPYTYAIRKNNRETIMSGSLEFAEGIAVVQAQIDEPSMLYVEVAGGGNSKPAHLGAAIAPSKLKPSIPRPDDFDAFWQSKLKALGEIPIHPELTPSTALRPGVDFYTVKLASVDPTRRASSPNQPGKENSRLWCSFSRPA